MQYTFVLGKLHRNVYQVRRIVVQRLFPLRNVVGIRLVLLDCRSISRATRARCVIWPRSISQLVGRTARAVDLRRILASPPAAHRAPRLAPCAVRRHTAGRRTLRSYIFLHTVAGARQRATCSVDIGYDRTLFRGQRRTIGHSAAGSRAQA